MKAYIIQTKIATGYIEIDDKDIVVKTPPIWRRYEGKSFDDFCKTINRIEKITRIE